MKILSNSALFLFLFLLFSAQLFPPKSDQLKPIHPSEAFRFHWEQSGEKVTLVWNIAENYYLYNKKFLIDPGSGFLIQKQIISPPSSITEDAYFGKQPIHEKDAIIELTLEEIVTGNLEEKKLNITYQGCWKKGICFPPQRQVIKISTLKQ